MAVLTISIVDQTFDKRSAECQYLVKVLDLVQAHLESRRGQQSGLQSVLGQNQAGTPNTVVAQYTYTPSTPNP
jgi:flagellar biosynthesis/type III secretory pathway chaperone